MADVSVRPARPADAPLIAQVQHDTWRQAYADLLPAETLEIPVERLAAVWQAAAAAPPSSRHHLLVALDGGELVGFAASGPDEDDPADAELTALLVLPRWGRRGHGSRLLAASVAAWRKDAVSRAVCWVLADDRATPGFLAGAGWEPDGSARGLDTGNRVLPQERYHADVAP